MNEAFRILVFALVVIVGATVTEQAFAQRAEDYFPLAPGMKYRYAGTYKERTFEETIISHQFTKANLKLIYFINDGDVTKTNSIIGSNMIGLGCYHNAKEGIYTYECFWTDDLKRVSQSKASLLFHSTLKKGDSLRFTSDGGRRTVIVSVVQFETASVPAGIFTDAVKIHIKEIWSDKTYHGLHGLPEESA